MKKNIRNQALLFGATVLGTILFAASPARAVDITQSTSQSGAVATGWAAAIWGTPAAIALANTNYITPATFFVRTPNNSAPAAFAGSSLRIDAGGVLWLKHNGGAASVNLVMNGGTIQFHGGTATSPSPLSGTIQVLADSTINSDQGSPNNRDIWLQSPLSGSANLTVAMNIATNSVNLSGSNSAYAGNWLVSGGFLQIVNGHTNALGSGSVTLVNANNSLTINTTNHLVITNLISGLGSVVKLNTNTVTLTGENTFTGTAVVNNGVLKLGSSLALASASVISLAGGTLDASLIGGLSLDAAGQSLNCRGTVIGNLTAATVNTLNFNLSTTTNDILNVSGSLTLDGNPALNLILTGFKPAGTYRLINYTGTIQGGGTFNVVPPVGSSQTFSIDIATAGQVNLIVTGIPQNLTWVGDGGANSWDTSSPNWTGTTNLFSAGDQVTFNDSGSAVPDINVVEVSSPSSMTVSNTSQPYLFYGLGISTIGTLTKAGDNELSFTSAGNNFTGPVDIRAGTLSIGAGGSGSFGAPSSITNNGVLRVNLAGGGQTFAGPISGTGSLEVTGGGASVTVTGTNSYTGLTTIGNECQLNIATSTALGTTGSGTVVLANGRLGVNSFVGSMTIAEPVIVNGVGITAAPGALYLNTVNNNVTYSGPITIGSDARFRAVNINVRMNFANAVLGTNVALQCTVGNAVTDTNAVMTFLSNFSLESGALTKDGQGVVVFASNTNVCGSTTINGGTLLVNGLLDGGLVTVNTSGTLGGAGTNLGPVAVLDGGSLAPGNSGVGKLTLNNTLTLAATSVVLMELNRTNAQNADLLSAAALPLDGTLTVENNGPALQAGDTFNLFDGTISGAFVVTNLPALASPSFYWDTSLLASQGIIKVASNMAPTPTITSPSVSGANFTLQVAASVSGFNYVLEATSALAPAAWTGIQTNAGTGGTLNFTFPITPATTQQFFRINVQ